MTYCGAFTLEMPRVKCYEAHIIRSRSAYGKIPRNRKRRKVLPCRCLWCEFKFAADKVAHQEGYFMWVNVKDIRREKPSGCLYSIHEHEVFSEPFY